MGRMLCLSCFRIKGEFQVCPYCGYVEASPPRELFQLKPGTILQNRYIIGGTIGCGGFGIIYRAYDTTLSIIVAVKEFYPARLVNRAAEETKVSVFSGDRAEEYHKLLNRFIDEARNMALFSKEKDIVNVFSYFEANGTAYIIMEYVEHLLLKQYLQQYGKLQEKQACQYACSILDALEKLHDKGIVHRDVSPDNIFVLPSNQIKLFDFGAAILQNGNKDCHLTAVVKTGYAPPEQYRFKGNPDCRLDIYAAGAVLYQMLTGKRPVESLERTQKETLFPLSKQDIRISPHTEKVLAKALSLNPEERYPSAAAFKEALQSPEKKRWKWW